MSKTNGTSMSAQAAPPPLEVPGTSSCPEAVRLTQPVVSVDRSWSTPPIVTVSLPATRSRLCGLPGTMGKLGWARKYQWCLFLVVFDRPGALGGDLEYEHLWWQKLL